MRSIAALALALAACGTSDSEPAPDATWQRLASDQPEALLAVWGSSSNDMWVVGSRSSPTGGPTILRYDGSAWTRVDSGQTSLDLWWVIGFPDGDVLFSGSGGTILRYRDGQFERLPTPSAAGTIFGMWGPSADDVWAVGDAGTQGGVVWHYDGQAFAAVAIPDGAPQHVFKVHGQATDDVWMSCSGGVTLHWNGSVLERIQTPTTNSLFSIITSPDLAIAVGGVGGMGDLLENASSAWSSAALQAPVPWRGTAIRGDRVVAVGESGLIAERGDATWTQLPQDLTPLNFHSAWLDDTDGLWVVGGLFDGRLSDGLLLHYGTQSIAEVTP
jgi:hypothetical protein